MKSKIITLIILLVSLLIGACFVFNNLKEYGKGNRANFDYLPKDNLGIVIHGEDLFQQLNQFFSTSTVWVDLQKEAFFKDQKTFFQNTDSALKEEGVQLSEITIAYYGDLTDYLLVGSATNQEDYNNMSPVKEITVGNKSRFLKYKEGKVLVSNNKGYLTNEFEDFISNDSSFLKVYKKSPFSLSIGVDYSNKKAKQSMHFLYQGDEKFGWYDVLFSEQELKFNGVSYGQYQKNENFSISDDIYEFIPQNTNSISFHSIKQMNGVDSLSELCQCNYVQEYLDWTSSHFIKFSGQYVSEKYMAVELKGLNDLREYLHLFGNINYNDTTQVYSIDSSIVDYQKMFKLSFVPSSMVIINQYLIFGVNNESIAKLKYNFNNRKSIKQQGDIYQYFKSRTKDAFLKKEISKGFSVSQQIAKGLTTKSSRYKNEELMLNSLEYTQATNLVSTEELAVWNVKLPYTIEVLHKVYNHRVKEYNVVIQDINNNVYFISANGEIQWERNIGEKILGNIVEVDIFNNGKKQMLFNTSSKVHLLDVLGRNVNSFPVTIDSATNPVNAFDYDKKGEYRFMVATKKGIVNLDENGKKVEGWKTPVTKALVNQQAQHLRVGIKDYVLLNDRDGNVYLYSRQGDVRHKTTGKYTSRFMPVDLGNNIETTRAIYFDPVSNFVKKHFFNQSTPVNVLFASDSFVKLHYKTYNQYYKTYVMEHKNKLEIYDKGGQLIHKLKLNSQREKLKINKHSVSYIDTINRELILVSKIDDQKAESITNVNNYIMDEKNTYDRIYTASGSNLKMTIRKRE